MNIEIFEYFEWAAFLTGTALFKYIRKTPFVILLPYLLLVVIIESGNHFGWFYDKQHKTNNWIYNILLIFEFPVISFLLLSHKVYAKRKCLFPLLTCLYCTFYTINILFFQNLWLLNTNTILVISVAVICLSINLLYKIASSDELNIQTEYSYFWFATGCLLFYVIEILLYAIFPFFAYSSSEIFLSFYIAITNIGITILYLSMIFSFYSVWGRKK